MQQVTPAVIWCYVYGRVREKEAGVKGEDYEGDDNAWPEFSEKCLNQFFGIFVSFTIVNFLYNFFWD